MSGIVYTGTELENISDSDFEMICRIVYAERGNGSQQQQEYVASVIMNRVISSRFPNTVEGVITAKKQFSSYGSANYLSEGWKSAQIQAAVTNVLENGDTTGGAVYFMTPSAAVSTDEMRNWTENDLTFLFNDVTGTRKPTSGDHEWNGTHNFYSTESILEELSKHTGGFLKNRRSRGLCSVLSE